MARMTWRTSDELLDRVRRQAQQRGHSLNDWITTVLSAASDPELAGDEARRIHERLAAAGLLETFEPGGHRRPAEVDVARARVAAGRGTPVSEFLAEARQRPSSGPPRLCGDDLRSLRGATARTDREAVRGLLAGKDPTLLLQHAGSALLAVGVDGLEDLARDVVERLTARADDGDDVLALALTAALGGPQPLLRPVRTDLEQVAELLAGDPVRGEGGYVDLRTGEVWPQVVLDNVDDDERPDLEEPDRWLHVPEEGSRERWNDRYEFAERLRPGRLRDSLLDALEGKGAFGRFARVLDREPALLDEWRAFSAEREMGRARAVLASYGYLALP